MEVGGENMLWVLMMLGWATVEKKPPPKKREKVCGLVPSHDAMFVLAKQYYERHGIWSGIFFLSRAHKHRVVKQGEEAVVYHLQYGYTPVPGNDQGRTDSGSDQRTFILRCEKGWYVDQMGAHMSAYFP